MSDPLAARTVTRLEIILAGLWVALWASINTTPDVLLGNPSSLMEVAHYIRTTLPLLVGLVVVLLLLGDAAMGPADTAPLPPALRLWSIYGLLGLAACATSLHPGLSAYWAVSYLVPIGIVLLLLRTEGRRGSASTLRKLNVFSWGLVGAYLLVLLVIARDQLVIQGETGVTGYGVLHRVGEVGGVLVPRASGFSRFAAIPGVVAFVLAVSSRGLGRLVWGVVAAGCAAVVYVMQSRGSMAGLVAAIAFATFFLSRRSRGLGLVLVVVLLILLATDVVPQTTTEEIKLHITRAQSQEEFTSLTGRTYVWGRALEIIGESPLWGHGPQADRYLLHEHVHNSYLYVLLQSGWIGLLAFVGGLVAAWISFFRCWASPAGQEREERIFLVQLGAILAFFTVRTIPEASGALFGIDLLVMVSAMAYLGVRAAQIHRTSTDEGDEDEDAAVSRSRAAPVSPWPPAEQV